MRPNGKDGDGPEDGRILATATREHAPGQADDAPTHVVFDFEELEHPSVTDLALILTARLQSAPGDWVWARAVPPHTARILRALHLGHLFRTFPVSETLQ